MRERDGREMGGNRRWGKRKGRGEGKNPVGGAESVKILTIIYVLMQGSTEQR